MKPINLSNVTAIDGSYAGLPTGGYICKITAIEDEVAKQYLKLEFDVAEGEFKGYYRDLWESKGFWGGTYIRSYKDAALGFFKHFTNCLEASNKGFFWNWDETQLKGKLIGLVLSEEEYKSSTGEIKTRLYASSIKPIDDIRKGLFKIANKKLIKQEVGNPTLKPVEDEGLPF